jgi:hypothetical protein
MIHNRFTQWLLIVSPSIILAAGAQAQSIAVPWSGLGHGPQHAAIAMTGVQTLNRIEWQTPVDLDPQYSGNDLYIHYGSPIITRANTLVIPVKTGAWGGFRVEGHVATTGSLVWMQPTDYILPAHDWIPSCGIAITPANAVYFPGAGGTVYYRDSADAATTGTGQIAFYGLGNYLANEAGYQADVQINTPLTCDRYGDVFFGFEVSGTTLGLQSGIARIDSSGTGTWISAATATGDSTIQKVVMNCAPALSNDHKTLYVTVNDGSGDSAGGYLLSLDSRTLAPISKVRLKDVAYPTEDANLPDDGTASPTIGPDGDVYIGVLEYGFPYDNNDRGWMLHFDSTLAATKIPGAFGWDDTPSIVPAAAVPSYSGTSAYLILTKYNNYAGLGSGNGVNKVAVLDPNTSETDPVSGQTTMNEVITVTGVTPDPNNDSEFPDAVREWCINSAVIDPVTKCAIVNSEDGNVYRWDFTTNSLRQAVTLSSGVGEAYTPSLSGTDGTAYVINNAQVFAIGQ